jgi:hypothetical protein
MTRADIPAAVLQFVLRRIDTVAELETLLIMSAEESRQWSVDDIAARIYVAKPSAAAVLHALQSHRLIAGDDAGTWFRFTPASEEERQTILQTATAYRTHLIPISTLIHKKASGPVQEFARAFSLKKDE